MAASKSASRKSAAKKASKTRKSRAAAKKAAKTRKQRAAGKKAAATRKRRAAAKKALATRKTKAGAATRAKTTANTTLAGVPAPVAEIDNRIAIVRNNLRELVEQAASYSGAAVDELMSDRISEQEAKLALLMKQREELSQRGS
jgi:hypothetical protein